MRERTSYSLTPSGQPVVTTEALSARPRPVSPEERCCDGANATLSVTLLYINMYDLYLGKCCMYYAKQIKQYDIFMVFGTNNGVVICFQYHTWLDKFRGQKLINKLSPATVTM